MSPLFHFAPHLRTAAGLLRRRPQLGLDIGRQHLRLAVLERCGSRLRLQGLAEHRFGQVICQRGRITDLDLLCRATRTLMTRCRVDDGVLVTALSLQAAAAVPLTLPAAASDIQRLAQVQAEMALRHPQPPDELVAHYCMLGRAAPASDDVRVLALFASVVDIEDRSALASSLQLRPGMVALRETRVAAFLRRMHRAPGAAILQVDQDDAWLALPGHSLHALDWSPRSDQPATLLHALAPLLRPPPDQLLLSGDTPMLADLAHVIGKYSDLPTQVATMSHQLCDMPRQQPPTPAFHAALALAAGAQT